MCLPREWNICPRDELCQPFKREFEDPSLCRVSLCSGATFLQFLSSSPCLLGSTTKDACKACLAPGQPSSWRCYSPITDNYGFQCDDPFSWSNPSTANMTFTDYCAPLINAAPSISLQLPSDAFTAISSGPAVLAGLTVLLSNGSLLELQADGSLLVNLDASPPSFVASLQSFAAQLASIAIKSTVKPEEIIVTKVFLLPKNRKRQSAIDAFDISLQFSLLKNDDPAASDVIAQQVVSALVQGVVPGVDPVSVSSTPATTPQFPGTTGNGTSVTPRPTEVARPRDPTSPLNGGAIFGIIFGSAIGLVVILGAFAWCFVRYRSSHPRPFSPAQATL